MISTGHHKHPKLARPALGQFGRTEWAVLGSHCEYIQSLSKHVIEALSPAHTCAYVDARHTASDHPTPLPGMLEAGAISEYTDLIQAHQFHLQGDWTPFQFRQLFHPADLILVNGNHHQAKHQVVLIDEAKAASLQRRVHQLTDVRLFLLKDTSVPVFDFLKEQLPEWGQVPVLSMYDFPGIVRFFEQELQQARPVLNGLVLAGGKSQRMGHDKGAIAWHGMPQRNYIAQLLQSFCAEVFISSRAEQTSEIGDQFPIITDTFLGLGPMGAILSAFRQNPDRAWFVIACDLPLLNHATLEQLVQARQTKCLATAFESPENQMPEPLIAIWEPKSYPTLLSFLGQGYSCPRKVLMNTQTCIIPAREPAALTNVNTPEELAAVRPLLK